MTRGTKILLGLLLGGATVGGIVVAARMGKKTAGPVEVARVPAGLPGAVDFNLPEGWRKFGWYSYVDARGVKWWIRIDQGPEDAGAVLTDLPWRWSVFVDKPGAEGYVPIATGEKTWTDLGVLYRIDALAEYAEGDMATMMTRAAADQIDAMSSEAA